MLADTSRRWSSTFAVALLLVACSSSGTAPDTGGTGGTGGTGSTGGTGAVFTAQVNGQSFAATTTTAQIVPGIAGGLQLIGTQTANNVVTTLTISLGSIRGVGTYALGVGTSVVGGLALESEGPVSGGAASSWITPQSGVAGTITIATLTGGRITGTFSYTAAPGAGNAVGGTRAITNGVFDLPFTATLSTVPDKIGSTMSATVGGASYNASTIVASLLDFTGSAGVTISSVSTLQALSITLVGVTAPGTYALSNSAPARLMTAGLTGGTASTCCWGVNAGGDVGSVTITSITSTRVKGTFTATLQPQPGKPATTPLTVTSGVFDVGVP